MDLYRTVSEIDGDFQSKIAKIFPPLVLCASAKAVPLRNGYRRWGQKLQ